jgi:uncharacterized protein (TIGR02001 family)
MKAILFASALASAAATVPTAALAQAPASPHTVTGNMAIVSDYRFRGISQTFAEGFDAGPAIQGGIDYSHASGFYLGNWNSNVSGNQYPNGSSIEMDFYGGWKGAWGDWGLDIGTIYYLYPGAKFRGTDQNGNSFSQTVNHWEVYVGGSWKWFSAKYFYSLTDYFDLSGQYASAFCSQDNARNGTCVSTAGPTQNTLGDHGDSKGTSYLTGAFNYEIMPKLALSASLGYTWVSSYSKLDYLDYKLGLTYDLNGWMLGAALVGTDADKQWWYASNSAGKYKDIGETTIVLSIGKTF